MLTVILTIMTITERYISSFSSYCDKKQRGICAVLAVIVTILTITGGIHVVLTVIVTIMTITGRYICSANSYCDNNGEVYM